MKIDQNPFPTNMVDIEKDKTPKVLTSDSARKNKSVDPKVQITERDIKGKGQGSTQILLSDSYKQVQTAERRSQVSGGDDTPS